MSSRDLPNQYRQIFEKLKGQIATATRFSLKNQPVGFIEDFAYTYLRCLNILSQVRTHGQWRKWAPPLQKLLVQANVLLYPEEETSLKSVWRTLWVNIPAQFWQFRYFHLASLLILGITTFIGFLIVHQNFEMASVFMPTSLRSSHELEAYLFSNGAQEAMLTSGREMSDADKTAFATFLYMNNTKVATLCFVSGFLFGLPTFIILVQTGLMLGTLPALFYGESLLGLWAWLLPHGVPEISAIILAGGAGLKLGLTMLNPGDLPMAVALKKTLRVLSGTILLCVALLVWAAIVESFIRQSELADSIRLTIAAFSVIPLFLLFLRGFFASQELQQSADLETFSCL